MAEKKGFGGVILVLVLLAGLAIVGWYAGMAVQIRTQGIEAPGKMITGLGKNRMGAIITFEVNGQVFEMNEGLFFPVHDPGLTQRVTVRYLKDDPRLALVEAAFPQMMVERGVGILAILAILAGLFVRRLGLCRIQKLMKKDALPDEAKHWGLTEDGFPRATAGSPGRPKAASLRRRPGG